MSDNRNWQEVIEWECDLNPSNIENTPDAIVSYQKDFTDESFSELPDEVVTVVLRVVETENNYLTVTAHEVTEMDTNPVFRKVCESVEEVEETLESVSSVYEDGRDAIRQLVENRVWTESLMDIEDTFSTDVQSFEVQSDYRMIILVPQVEYDLLEFIGSHTTGINVYPVNQETLRVECEPPVIF